MDQWVTKADRDAAIRRVEIAWGDGQIAEAERNRRVGELVRAETAQEVELLVRDLRAPSYEPVPEAPAGHRAEGTNRGSWVVTALALLLSVVLVAGVFVVLGLTEGDDAEAEGPVPVLTGRGYDDLVDAVREETGSTEAFEAVLYQDYASLDLPVDATSQREQSWFWDGDLTTSGTSTSTDERFDLADVDMALVLGLLTRLQQEVDQETSWYAIVHAPAEQDGSVYQVYMTNDFQETASVTATADGTITYESAPDPSP